MSESSQTSDTKTCKKCGRECDCGDNCECNEKDCGCKDSNSKDKNLKGTIKILSDMTKKEKSVVFDSDFDITVH